MDTRDKQTVSALAELSGADLQRLVRLAKLGGRTPETMLPFVLRDGFEECERMVIECNEAAQEIARGDYSEHADVMRSVKLMLAEHAKRQKSTG